MVESERTSAIHCPDLMSYWALLAPMVLASERPVESSFGRKQMCSWATKQLNERPQGQPSDLAQLSSHAIPLILPIVSFGAQEGTI